MPLPHLFQRRWGATRHMISPQMVKELLRQALDRTGLTGPDGEPLHYTPHDFRRIFVTEAVSGGLPVHIAVRLLGHHDLATTRRALRPGEEYREPTDAEWNEFGQHFARRKVELGTCARPYGTPCAHEARIRCPVLRMDPRQGVRLAEIITGLHERIREASAGRRAEAGAAYPGRVHKILEQRDPALAFPLASARDDADERRQANRAVAVSAAGLAVTGLVELLLALLTGSVGLLGDAIHNLSDVSTSAVVFLGFRLSRRPPTERYPYGLERAEDLAGVGIAIVIWASAAFAGYESIRKLIDHGHTL